MDCQGWEPTDLVVKPRLILSTMSKRNTKVNALEINADMIGALFTDRVGDRLRVFCFYVNGDTGQFDAPLAENCDSLHSLFAKLDMVGQCTSVVLEKVVRGRIYVENNGALHSYTLLATPGVALPSLNAEIHNLPWKTIWASQEADILRLNGGGGATHCYAIRSPVNDVEAPALYRSSNAFLEPQSATEKGGGVYQWGRQAAVVAVMAAVFCLGWWLGHSENGTGAQRVAAREITKTKITANAQSQAQMLANRAITGPYTMAELGQMNQDGKIPADAMFRVVGSTEWVSFRDMTTAGASPVTAGKKL